VGVAPCQHASEGDAGGRGPSLADRGVLRSVRADDFSRAPVRLGVLGVNYLPGKVPAAGRTHATKCWAGYTPRVAGAVLLARDVAVAGAGDPCPLGSDVIVHGGRSAVSLLEFNQFAASAFAGRCPFHAGR